ncbi:fibronectin type III domain-containing protein [Marinobacter halophilus]|uniref:fibronectin type III domain-containing protein n=1 Tax=Marinobacter halophilus TaxID=1323740 RepID=UPI001D109A14|nr:fibronectin type III domain-containing protein [Marinobacter halophilus]
MLTFTGLCVSALIIAPLLSGCQEDSRASKLDPHRASAVADARLKQAQSNLMATFGQRTPDARTPHDSFDDRQPTLAWTAPLTREDGSSLAPGQISGYRIYYRLKHTRKFDIIPLSDASTTRYPLNGMPPGAYEFSISTVDVDGLESRRSEPVQVNLI